MDPEQVIAGYSWRFDPDTLREVLDETDTALFHRVRAGLTAKLAAAGDDATRARLLSLRAAVGRSLMDLDRAVVDGRRGLAHAEAAGDARLIAVAQVRLAHVYQWRREFGEADRLFAAALAADLSPAARASVRQHAGKNLFDQGRYAEAREHFERAREVRRDGDPDLLASTEVALDAVRRRLAR
jgi:tetratricopeptide (TPR) repeat protein